MGDIITAIGSQNGTWPTAAEVFAKIGYSAPDGLIAALTDDVDNLLSTVIAEFQSAIGRRLVAPPAPATRYFDPPDDRLGYLDLPDLASLPTVAYQPQGGSSTAFVIHTDYELEPLNALDVSFGPADPDYHPIRGLRFFRRWLQPAPQALYQRKAVQVTGLWGFALTVPPDVWEAVRGEVASRALVQGAVPLSGIGDMLSIGAYSINTAAGVSVWKESSPIAVMHRTFEATVARYRYRLARYL